MQAGRISQMDLDELSDVRKEYLLRSFFRDMYWGKGATEWDTVRNQMENSVSKRIFETKERLESNYIEKVRQEFKANSGYDVEKIEIVNKTESPQFSEIWDSGKFAIPVKSSELKEILEKGLVGKNRQVSISSSDALFTETPYFAGLSENFSTEETNDGICYLIYTAHSETEFSALPYNCELQTKDGRTFFAVKREESPYIDKTDYFIPSHDIRAVIVGNENMFNFVVDKLTGSEVKGVPVVQLSPKKPLSAL